MEKQSLCVTSMSGINGCAASAGFTCPAAIFTVASESLSCGSMQEGTSASCGCTYAASNAAYAAITAGFCSTANRADFLSNLLSTNM